MNRRRLALATFALSFVAALPALALSPTEDSALARAATRGRLIYAYDQAAWVSSDELLRRFPDPHTVGVAGYVVEPEGSNLRAIYYRMDGGAPKAVLSADVNGSTLLASHVFAPGEPADLSPLARRLAGARTAAEDAAERKSYRPCGPAPFNTVALPPETPDAPVPVYLLSPQVKDGQYPFGGHFEVDIAADGRVASSRAFTKSCIAVDAPPPSADAQADRRWITHLLDPTPTEIHVYLALWTGQPVIVATTSPSRNWEVSGDQIRLLKPNGR